MALSAARQVSEDRCQDPLRSRNLEIGKAGLRPEWAGDVIPDAPKRPPLLPLSLKRSATTTGFGDFRHSKAVTDHLLLSLSDTDRLKG